MPASPKTGKGGGRSLKDVLGLDRLEVGPVKLTATRLSAPYAVIRDGQTSTLELAYRYEERVFDPAEPESQNLASVIAAQVALNYGLFCREIVFRGHYDEADKRFLQEMMANTAREIYVKKLLEENHFLTEGIRGLPLERKESYVQAEVRFETAEQVQSELRGWRTSADRFAVLSSGGKDSLLSFGLLQEMELETHPIFINESGRHWFTALNAYRHFRSRIAKTARVWTSSDRVFSGMLRHLDFVRRDFQRIRSDEYPIRLWTVAVFLFGALPILRKRGIGRLVIGDEHDTTVRRSHKGVPHYDGLYDQSRYFDNALTRYFLQKGWGVTQFSIVRPLSELLVEKTLAERYQELQRHQVSCHAAHEEGGRVRPCGRCEKCRRIVGMLLASGADPSLCGYKTESIEGIRRDLETRGIHQEKAGVEHLGSLLYEQGSLSEPRLGGVTARSRPEVMSLRFHGERSPVDAIPRELRRPLYSILLESAQGSVRRVGRTWQEFDLLGDPELAVPYPFDRPHSSAKGLGRGPKPGGDYLWGELSWPEAQRRFRQVDIALLPVGAVEQHGHHLPLDTDAFDADYLAREVAASCGVPRPLVLPLLPYGVSYHHEDFAGTVSVTNDALAMMVYDIGMSVAGCGITKLVIINGHGGNSPALNFAAQMINRDAGIFTCVDSGETSDPDVYALAETRNDVHAGEIETSTSLAVRPHLVRMDRAHAFVPRFSSHYLDFTSSRGIQWYARTSKISESGVFGDPTKATRKKGEAMWRVMIRNLVSIVEHLKGLSLAEIHERRT